MKHCGSKDTVQIHFAEVNIVWQILHFCQTVVGEIDFLDAKKKDNITHY